MRKDDRERDVIFTFSLKMAPEDIVPNRSSLLTSILPLCPGSSFSPEMSENYSVFLTVNVISLGSASFVF